MSNQSDFLKALAGGEGLDRGGESNVADVFDLIVEYQKDAADGAAATATNHNVWRNLTGANFRVVGVQIIPDASLTADPTNNAVITIQRAQSAGAGLGAGSTTGAPATVATTSGGTGSWVADTPIVVPLSATAANLLVVPNDILGLDIAKGGSGVAVPACAILVQLRRV